MGSVDVGGVDVLGGVDVVEFVDGKVEFVDGEVVFDGGVGGGRVGKPGKPPDVDPKPEPRGGKPGSPGNCAVVNRINKVASNANTRSGKRLGGIGITQGKYLNEGMKERCSRKKWDGVKVVRCRNGRMCEVGWDEK